MKKQTESPFTSSDVLFERNGKSSPRIRPGALEILETHAKPYQAFPPSVLAGLDGIFFLFKDKRCVKIGQSEGALWIAFYNAFRNLNGLACEIRATVIPMPSKNIRTRWPRLYQTFIRERMKNYFGEKLAREELLDDEFLGSYADYSPFYLLASRNGRNEENSCILHPLPAAREDSSGIYFIREHKPGDPPDEGEVVYMGVSKCSLKATIKNHFRGMESKQKQGPHQRDRAEIRGDWVRKIKEEGYAYYVAPIVMLPPVYKREFPAFKRKIHRLETRYVQLLNPRDNLLKKRR